MKAVIEKRILVWGCMLLLLLALAACRKTEESISQDQIEDKVEKANKEETDTVAANDTADVQVEEEEQEEQEVETIVSYTTITGKEVMIPSKPQRVIYLGDKLGDFLALEIPVVGSNLIHASGMFCSLSRISDYYKNGCWQSIWNGCNMEL